MHDLYNFTQPAAFYFVCMIQRITCLWLVSLLLQAHAHAQTSKDSLFQYIDSVIRIVRADAYNSHDVNWQTIRDSMHYYAGKATSLTEAGPVFSYLFRALNDDHGGILYNNRYFGTYQKHPARPDPLKDSLLLRLRAREFPFITRRLNGYGYLRLPSLGALTPKDIEAMARRIRDSVCQAALQHVKGWIIDLRFNPGGNPYGMITGLAGFLPPSAALTYTFKNGDTAFSFRLKNYNLVSDDYAPTALDPICQIIGPNMKVAILTSRLTGSAGELTAYFLRQHPRAQIIGERTAGMTSGTMFRPIGPNFGVNYTRAYPLSKKGTPLLYIEPDVLLPGNFSRVLLEDWHVRAALEWLREE